MTLSKRERLERTFASEATDRVPVALWRHWQGDDQDAGELAKATVNFQQRWDWDFVKLSPADSYPLNDHGTADEWHGTLEGVREYTQRAIHQPEDWTKLQVLDPQAGWLGRHLETIRLVREALGESVPIIHTIFSPIAQAKNLAGERRFFRHLHQYPDAVQTGLGTLAETTARYVSACTEADGLYYAVQHATYDDMTADQYATYGKPYDLQVLEARPQNHWFTMLHVHGSHAPMFDLFTDFPVQAINWHDRESGLSLREGAQQFAGAVSGGLGAWDALHNGTPADVRAQAADAIEQTGGKRLILASGCVMMTTTPQGNIRAVRDVVEG